MCPMGFLRNSFTSTCWHKKDKASSFYLVKSDHMVLSSVRITWYVLDCSYIFSLVTLHSALLKAKNQNSHGFFQSESAGDFLDDNYGLCGPVLLVWIRVTAGEKYNSKLLPGCISARTPFKVALLEFFIFLIYKIHFISR